MSDYRQEADQTASPEQDTFGAISFESDKTALIYSHEDKYSGMGLVECDLTGIALSEQWRSDVEIP